LLELESGGATLHLAGEMQGSLDATARGAAATDSEAAASAPPPQWLAPDWVMYPLAARRCLVRNPLNGASAQLDAGEYAVLSTCEDCRTLEEHVARAMRQLSAPQEHRAAFRQVFERGAREGLLLSVSDLVARLGPPQGEPASCFGGLVIRTCDRPQQLRRVLGSVAEGQSRIGASYPWHVIDDSRREESRRANQEALREYRSLDASYHDSIAVDTLAGELEAVYPDLAGEIRSLIGGPRGEEVTYGRPLNYAGLRFAGYRLLILDDDVIFEPRRPPSPAAGVEVGAGREVAFWYESIEEAYAACPPVDCNPVEEHLRWLGLPLAQAWAQAERERGGLKIGQLSGETAARFAPDARVLLTRSAVLGDPGWTKFSAQQLLLADETRAWLVAHPDAIRYAFESQTHWRGSVCTAIRAHMLWSMFMGLDNTRLVPPTLRTGAGEDVVFAEAARCIYPRGWTVEVPFAFAHVRAQRRQWLAPRDKPPGDPARFLTMYARGRAEDISASEPLDRMTRLAEIFLDLGVATEAALAAVFEEQAVQYASTLRFGISEQLDDAALPDAWKSVLREWLDSPMLRLDGESLHASMPPLATVRALASEYGRMLKAWPRLWTHCRERQS
jgi:hypothetical protein